VILMPDTINLKLASFKDELAGFCKRNHILKLSLFGSALTRDFSDNSDIDLLVQFKPDHIPGLLEIVAMEQELSQMFGGRKIDLRTAEDLSRYFRAEIIDRAVSQYEVS
jgi:predicted nucleotidyltransferase